MTTAISILSITIFWLILKCASGKGLIELHLTFMKSVIYLAKSQYLTIHSIGKHHQEKTFRFLMLTHQDLSLIYQKRQTRGSE